MACMDKIDRMLLDLIQSDFPVASRPYKILAGKVGITEQDALERISRHRASGLIRRIGANFQSRKIGFVSTLCAARVAPEKKDAFIERVNAEPGVTHNYERDHEYNIWFTLIAESVDKRDSILKSIHDDTGVLIHNLPASRMYKIKVDFPMDRLESLSGSVNH